MPLPMQPSSFRTVSCTSVPVQVLLAAHESQPLLLSNATAAAVSASPHFPFFQTAFEELAGRYTRFLQPLIALLEMKRTGEMQRGVQTEGATKSSAGGSFASSLFLEPEESGLAPWAVQNDAVARFFRFPSLTLPPI